MPNAPTQPVDTAPAHEDIAPVHVLVVAPAPTALDQPIRELETMSVPGPVDSPVLDPEAFEPQAIDPVGEEDAHDGESNEEESNEEGNADASANSNEDDDSLALTALLESLLFVASEPVEPSQLARTLAQPLQRIEEALMELANSYQQSKRGLRLQRLNGKVQLVTAPAAASSVEHFLNLDTTTRLSGPALEALAIIAYRQPVTRAQIEAVRGVDCAGVLRSLVQRGLVADVGRAEGVGRPILYGVTELFMQHFGLMEIGELPPLEESDADRLWAATILEEQSIDGMPLSPGEEPS